MILASLYSFGVLLAFTAAQLAVVRLRSPSPSCRGRSRSVDAVRRACSARLLTAAVFVALARDARSGADRRARLWLAGGSWSSCSFAARRGTALTRAGAAGGGGLVPEQEGAYSRILVPVKLGPIGEEVLATAIRLAEEHGGPITALHVVQVPLD